MADTGAELFADRRAVRCVAVHCDAIDRRAHTDLDRDYVRLLHLEGMARTLAQLNREGLL